MVLFVSPSRIFHVPWKAVSLSKAEASCPAMAFWTNPLPLEDPCIQLLSCALRGPEGRFQSVASCLPFSEALAIVVYMQNMLCAAQLP